MTTDLLEREGVLLARLPLWHMDSLALYCDFQPTARPHPPHSEDPL
ncbi:hypothetical protein [Deinococcus murrayi]|nr:hypothetical protein [Deinococcus murrayi]